MLVISRRTRQRVLIGDDVAVEVLPDKGGNIRLGIVAPPDVPVDREEIAEAKRRAGLAAAGKNVPPRLTPPRRPAA